MHQKHKWITPYVLEHFYRISKMSKLSLRRTLRPLFEYVRVQCAAARENIDLRKCHTYANVAKEVKYESAQVSFISRARRPLQICSDP